MSHVVKMVTKYKSLPALVEAGRALGWEFLEGQKTYRGYGTWVGDYPMPEGVKKEDLGKCEHAFRVPGATYEVGLRRDAEGNWMAVWDFWRGGGLDKSMGTEGKVLKRAYAQAFTRAQLRKAGFSQRSVTEQDGRTRVVFVRG